MLHSSKNFKPFFAIVLTSLLITIGGIFNYTSAQQNSFIDPDAYSVVTNTQNNVILPLPFNFPKSTFVFTPGDNILADTMTLAANPGPANNGGSAGWAMFLDLIAGNNNVVVTQMSTANTGAANVSFSVQIFTRVGTALGGPVGIGPGSSNAGWTSLGSVPAVQGTTGSGISLIFSIPPILVHAHDTVGVAIQFAVVGPRYFGTGSPPIENYSDTNLTLRTGEGRSAPFTPTGSWFSSRALCGVIRYVVESAIPNGWTRQNPSGVTTALNTVSTVNQNVGWIGGNNGVVLRTTNAGANWTNVTGAPIGTDAVYAICGIDANTCLVSTSPAATFVYKTTNGGVNWTQVFTQLTGFIDDIKMMNATTGFMYGDPVGARWSLWKTTNAGSTWDSTGLFLPQVGSEAGWNNAMWLIGNCIWFGTNNTKIYYSSNFGSSWSFGATTGSVNSYSVAFNGCCPSTGFTGQTIALKTTNCGAWATATLPGTGTIYSFNNVLDRFWYCRGTGVYWSNDNGANFASQFADTGTYQAMHLKLDGQVIRGWAVTSNGRIARYHEVISGITNNHNEIPESYVLMQNYPNPFNPSTKISFSLPKAGNVTLVVYDILGREVATIVNEFTTAGNHTINFNASNLSSGVYLYKIQAGDFTETKKMMLIK